MTKRLVLSFTEKQMSMLTEAMEKQGANNKTAYMAMLVSEKLAELTKRGPGRPKTKDEDPDEEEVANIPNPDKMDAPYTPMLTRSEYEARRAMTPKLYPPLD